LGVDSTQLSPALQQTVITAAIGAPSFEQARMLLEHLAQLQIDAKHIERVSHRIGRERSQERDQRVRQFEQKTLMERKSKPAGVTPPVVAVVGVDGGRLQIRGQPGDEDQADAEHRGKHWREDKIGLLMSMTSEEQPVDPAPEVPASFLEPTRMEKLTRQLKTRRAASEATSDTPRASVEDKPLPQVIDTMLSQELLSREPRWKPPEVEDKTCLATRQPWAQFGPMVAAQAWSLGFYQSPRRAFLGDGAECNWTLHRERFSSFTAILDIIHAISYVYAAALAGDTLAVGWQRYVRWVTWLWKGQVALLLEELQQRLEELGLPTPGESDSPPRAVVQRTLGYLQHHQDKMRYDEYRRLGLPITSSYVESAVKQFNQRVKGSEKFWTEAGAEAILQLRADYLCTRSPLKTFWKTRQAAMTGQRLRLAA
jgi:hypothetical protein